MSQATKNTIVVGGGIIGLATAFELHSQGLEVTLIDPAPISGATYHAGGMLAPVAEVVYQQDPLFPLMQESSSLYPSLISRVAQHTEKPTGYQDAGTLVVAADRADAQHLVELKEYQKAQGMTAETITVRAARSLEPALSPRLAAAVDLPGDTQVSPRMFALALLDAVKNMGVRVITEKVTDISGSKVTTDKATYEAETIILTAGLGAGEITGWYEEKNPLKLRPVYGDILRLEVPAHLRPLCTRVVRGFVEDRPIYIIPRVDNTVAIGATSREDEQPNPLAGGVYDLLRDAIRIVPGIEECTFIEATAGARPGTPDDLPYLGRVSEHLIISTGYFRHGILLAAMAADSAAALATGSTPRIDLQACNPLRHEKI